VASVRWDRVVLKGELGGYKKIARQVRYIHLNPCRAALTDDPLRWLWSTHRDVVGAVVDPWIDGLRLAPHLGKSTCGFEDWFHGYVSADPTVHVAGTFPPAPASACDVPSIPLANVATAARAAMRAGPSDIRRIGQARRLFLCLAHQQGWRDPRQLAAMCAMSTKAVRWNFARASAAGLAAAALCLGDDRLMSSPLPLADVAHGGWDDRVIGEAVGV
jgi:hypothetical protein